MKDPNSMTHEEVINELKNQAKELGMTLQQLLDYLDKKYNG